MSQILIWSGGSGGWCVSVGVLQFWVGPGHVEQWRRSWLFFSSGYFEQRWWIHLEQRKRRLVCLGLCASVLG